MSFGDLRRLDDYPRLGPVPGNDLRVQLGPLDFLDGDAAGRVRNKSGHAAAEVHQPRTQGIALWYLGDIDPERAVGILDDRHRIRAYRAAQMAASLPLRDAVPLRSTSGSVLALERGSKHARSGSGMWLLVVGK
jgi:hypothetical protein